MLNKRLRLAILGLAGFASTAFGSRTVIFGHVAIPDAQTVKISSNSNLWSKIHNIPSDVELALTDSGNYRFEFDCSAPYIFHMKVDDAWQFSNKFVTPGDSIRIDVMEDELRFEGLDETHNMFLFNWERKFFLDSAVRAEYNSSWSRLTPREFLEYWSTRRTDQLIYLNSYFQTDSASQLFMNYLRSEIDYTYAVALLQYSWRGKSRGAAVDIPEFVDAIMSIPQSNTQALMCGTYLHYLNVLPKCLYNYEVYHMDSFAQKTAYEPMKQFTFALEVIDKYFSNYPGELATAIALEQQVSFLEMGRGRIDFEQTLTSRFEILNREFESRIHNPAIQQYIQNKLDLVKGNPISASNFRLLSVNGDSISLSDFAGKVVYLDFWSTYCAPCVAEIPSAIELQKQFEKKDIVFINVALNYNLDEWKQFIRSRELQGVHLIARGGFASDVAKAYDVTSIPRYYLIGKDGMIINAQAPRPSLHPEELIESALLED